MAVTGLIHHIGTFLLFTATVLLIVTNITAPVVHHLSLLRVNLEGNSAVTLGTFGYCVLNDARGGIVNGNDRSDRCSPSTVGYNPTEVVGEAAGLDYYQTAEDTTRALTKVMILHPIATAISFVAFALSLGAGMFGSLLAAMVALLAFTVSLVVLITDFVFLGIVRTGVNESRSTSATASFGEGLWTLLAATICLLFGTVIVFFSCCSARMHRRRDGRHTKAVDGYSYSADMADEDNDNDYDNNNKNNDNFKTRQPNQISMQISAPLNLVEPRWQTRS